MISLSRADPSVPDQPSLQSLSLTGEEFSGDDGFTEALDHELLYFNWNSEDRELYYACFVASSEPETSEQYYESEGLIVEMARERGEGSPSRQGAS